MSQTRITHKIAQQEFKQVVVRQWVSSFLTARQHSVGYAVS